MGSLTASGLPITQAQNIVRHSHGGNFVRVSNTQTDVETRLSNSGVIYRGNYARPHGVSLEPAQSRAFVSGLPNDKRELQYNAIAIASGLLTLERNKFINDSGNLQHVVTRAMGIHTSITDKESPNSSLGPMVARTERKVFFTDQDTGKTSGFSNWKIYDASGCPVGATQGITDTDVSPEPTYDQPC